MTLCHVSLSLSFSLYVLMYVCCMYRMMVPIIRYCTLNEGVIPADGTVVAEGLVVILLGFGMVQ